MGDKQNSFFFSIHRTIREHAFSYFYYIRPEGGGGLLEILTISYIGEWEFGESYVRISIIIYCSEFFFIFKKLILVSFFFQFKKIEIFFTLIFEK